MSEIIRLRSELTVFTREIKAGFITAVALMKAQRPDGLFKLQIVATSVGSQFANLISRQFITAGDNAANAANKALGRLDLFFNRSLPLVAQTLQRTQARITGGIVQTVDTSARIGLMNKTGLINSIGLSRTQSNAVDSYRKLLQTGSLQAIQRELRDRTVDEIIESALSSDPLTPDEIDVMVSRYIDNQVGSRAQTIAETEAVRIVNQANQMFWMQQIELGLVIDVTQRWVSAAGNKSRESHRSLDGVVVPLGDPFVSGRGNQLSFPGDPRAPQTEILNCRCILVTEVES